MKTSERTRGAADMVGNLGLLGCLYRRTEQGDLRALFASPTRLAHSRSWLRSSGAGPPDRQLERGRPGTGRLFVRSVAVPDPGELPGWLPGVGVLDLLPALRGEGVACDASGGKRASSRIPEPDSDGTGPWVRPVAAIRAQVLEELAGFLVSCALR
jgi:hypothetical protein